ncbi:bacteriocin-like protein [Chryseobacterium lactis]|uniref:bacteriocin-like protein n=1 Tax=Chryseobacterium lactis TaxID=1241981 RepID=UPI0013DDE7A0|nr:hypothetical protein [Chryseobacterium lactis]
MKNIKKLSRENLRTLKGGITQECARIQSEASYCESKTNPPKEGAINACNKWCYY